MVRILFILLTRLPTVHGTVSKIYTWDKVLCYGWVEGRTVLLKAKAQLCKKGVRRVMLVVSFDVPLSIRNHPSSQRMLNINLHNSGKKQK